MHIHHRFFSMYHHRPGLFLDWNEDDNHACYAGRGTFGGRHHRHDEFLSGWNGLHGGGRRGGGGRMFGHGDLRLLLLALIEQQPRHGYELIRTIEDMFNGQYSPSPGTIYPTLTMLEDMGYVAVESEEGGRKRYAITEAGRAFLEENRDAVEVVTRRTERNARMAAKLAAPMAIRKAMHELKHALLMRSVKWDKAEAERVIAIMERAARDIATGGSKD